MKGGGVKSETFDDPRGFDPELEKLIGTSNYKLWTDEEMATLKRYYGKVKTEIIAKKLGKTQGAVKVKARLMGLKFSEGGV
jgi:NAD+--asparagine ADP-ribosyltransferase